MMNLIRKKSIIVGVLLILSIVVGILSIDTVVDTLDNLADISINANSILIRAFMQFALAIIYASIPIILYSLFKKINNDLAIGFLVFRMIAVVFIIIGWISILLLLTLSYEFVKVEGSELSYFKIVDNLLRLARDLINHVVMPLILSIGNLIFFYILYQSKLVPRWLSVWGVTATILSSILASILLMFNVIKIITPIYIVLALPTALLDIVLAIWLIVKGFDFDAVNYISENK